MTDEQEFGDAPDINSLPVDLDGGPVEQEDETSSVFDFPPPPPEFGEDGKPITYNLRLKLVENGAKKPVGKDSHFPLGAVGSFPVKGVQHFQVVIDHLIESDDPKVRGQFRDWVGTLTRGDRSPVGEYLGVLGVSTAGMANGRKAKALYDALVAEPVVQAQIQWYAQAEQATINAKSGKEEYVEHLRGMTNFPKVTIGGATKYKAAQEVKVGDRTVSVRTKFRIKRFVGKALPATGGSASAFDDVPF